MISLLMKTEYQIKRIQLLIRSAILAQENKIPSSMYRYLFFYNYINRPTWPAFITDNRTAGKSYRIASQLTTRYTEWLNLYMVEAGALRNQKCSQIILYFHSFSLYVAFTCK